MSSAQRSSSGVRNLRAMFENGESSTNLVLSPDRGRSPANSTRSGLVPADSRSPVAPRKISSNFVAVESSEKNKMAEVNNELAERFGEKNTMPTNGNTIEYTQTEHTEKPFSAVEDQSAELLPADVTLTSTSSAVNDVAPASDSVVATNKSGDQENIVKQDASKPSHETAQKTVQKRSVKPVIKSIPSKKPDDKSKTTSRLSASSNNSKTTANTKIASHAGAPTQAPKAQTSKVPAPQGPSAQTQASQIERRASNESHKLRPVQVRSPTRPDNISAHLLAPTASFAAKTEKQPTSGPPSDARLHKSTNAVPLHLMQSTASSAAKHDKNDAATTSATKRDRSSMASTGSVTDLKRSTLGSGRQSISNTQTRSRTATADSSRSGAGTTPQSDFLSRMSRPNTTKPARSSLAPGVIAKSVSTGSSKTPITKGTVKSTATQSTTTTSKEAVQANNSKQSDEKTLKKNPKASTSKLEEQVEPIKQSSSNKPKSSAETLPAMAEAEAAKEPESQGVETASTEKSASMPPDVVDKTNVEDAVTNESEKRSAQASTDTLKQSEGQSEKQEGQQKGQPEQMTASRLLGLPA